MVSNYFSPKAKLCCQMRLRDNQIVARMATDSTCVFICSNLMVGQMFALPGPILAHRPPFVEDWSTDYTLHSAICRGQQRNTCKTCVRVDQQYCYVWTTRYITFTVSQHNLQYSTETVVWCENTVYGHSQQSLILWALHFRYYHLILGHLDENS